MNVSAIAGALSIGLASIGTSLSIGFLAARAMDAIARQPQAGNSIRISMVIAIAFIEAIALYALVVSLILITK